MSFTARSAFATSTATASELSRYELPVAVEADRRDRPGRCRVRAALAAGHVDALDLAGEQVIDAAEDAGRVGDHGVRAGPAQVVGGQPFENLVRDAVGGGDRDVAASRGR